MTREEEERALAEIFARVLPAHYNLAAEVERLSARIRKLEDTALGVYRDGKSIRDWTLENPDDALRLLQVLAPAKVKFPKTDEEGVVP